jgi:hypothetical protein
MRKLIKKTALGGAILVGSVVAALAGPFELPDDCNALARMSNDRGAHQSDRKAATDKWNAIGCVANKNPAMRTGQIGPVVSPAVPFFGPVVISVGGHFGSGTKSSTGETVATAYDSVANAYVLGNQNIDRSHTLGGVQARVELPVWIGFVGVEGRMTWGLTDTTVNAGIIRETSSQNDWGINAIVGVPLWSTGARIAGRVGYGQFNTHYSQLDNFGRTFTGSVSKGGLQYGATLDYLFGFNGSKNWAADVTYLHTDLDQFQLGRNVPVSDNRWTVGLSYRFGGAEPVVAKY